MSEPALVFPREGDGRLEIVVNFGVFSGREATEAEIARLAHALLDEVESIEIVAERRYEFDRDAEAAVHLIRILLPPTAGGHERALLGRTEAWAQETIGERRVSSP